MENQTAEELMQIYVDGHPDMAIMAFNELYERYSERIYQYALKKMQIRSDAEDVLQKVFLKLHTSKHLFNPKFKFEQWIFVIAKTSVLDALRKRVRDVQKIEALFSEKELFLPIESKEMNSFDPLETLDGEKKQLLEWKYVDELSYNEIAKLVNKSEASLRKTMSRLIFKLKEGGNL